MQTKKFKRSADRLVIKPKKFTKIKAIDASKNFLYLNTLIRFCHPCKFLFVLIFRSKFASTRVKSLNERHAVYFVQRRLTDKNFFDRRFAQTRQTFFFRLAANFLNRDGVR
jgi:hypothetical protein